MRTPILLFITVSQRVEAELLAETLLRQRLVAGVNLIPQVQSLYWWNDAIQRHSEIVLLAHSVDTHVPAIEALLRHMHSYETPCLTALPFAYVEKYFADWIIKQTDTTSFDVKNGFFLPNGE